MSADDSKILGRRYIEGFWNGTGPSADQLIAEDYAVHDPGTPGRMGGVEGERQCFDMYHSVFPDLHFSVEDVFGDGDEAVVRWVARGTHRGELMGMEPTGKAMEVTGISILRIANQRITEHWLNWDTLGMLQQLGAIPAPG
jgi:steroid delta-isomerase-like uncharacterized protein